MCLCLQRRLEVSDKEYTTFGDTILFKGHKSINHIPQQQISLQILSSGMGGDFTKVRPKSGPSHTRGKNPNMTTKEKSHLEGGGCTHYGNLKHHILWKSKTFL